MRSGACRRCGFHPASSRPRRSTLEAEHIAHAFGPASDVEAVVLQQRQGDALDAEADAGGVGDVARAGDDVPGAAEQVAVIVEPDAGRRTLRRGDRHQQLELEALFALAGGEQTAGPAEKRIVGDLDVERQAERGDDLLAALHPALAEFERLAGCTQPHVLALAKHLHARRIDRRLVAEDVGVAIDQRALRPQAAARSDRGIDAVAGGRRERDVRGLLARRPVAALLQDLEQRAVIAVVAGEAVDRADELRRALEIAALLELPFADAGREAHHVRLVRVAQGAEGGVDALDDVLERAAAGIESVDTHRNQQPVLQQFVAKGAMRIGERAHPSSSGSSRSASRRPAVLPRMRSLLTISAAEWASRKWRPRLWAESLR